MEKQLRIEIVNEVRKAMQSINENWVTADTLCKHVEVLTPRWLKAYGSAFNRTRVEWVDDKGAHKSSYIYPLHEIMQMVSDGRIKNLKVT